MLAPARILAAVVALGLAGPALAQPNPLYQARTLTTGTDLRDRPAGLARCLADVLVKASGDPSLRADGRIEVLGRQAAAMLEDLDYQDRDGHLPMNDEQGSRDRPYLLTCRFSPRAIDAALRSLGSRPWTGRRPALLAEVTITDRSGDTFPLLADTPKGDGQRAALVTAAERTGLRVSLPRTDGARLPGAIPLRGELRWSDAEFGWVAEWRMDWREKPYRWRIAGVSYDAALRAGTEGAAAVLSGNAGRNQPGIR